VRYKTIHGQKDLQLEAVHFNYITNNKTLITPIYISCTQFEKLCLSSLLYLKNQSYLPGPCKDASNSVSWSFDGWQFKEVCCMGEQKCPCYIDEHSEKREGKNEN